MNNFGFYIIPCILGIVIIIGLYKQVPIFDTFLEGAFEGLKSTVAIAPSLIGLITAVSILKSSGALDVFKNLILPLTQAVKFPADVIPLALLRPVSGSGSLALLDGIFKNHGANSYVGKLASLIMGSTETTFYTIAVYFGSIKIKNSKHAIPCALLADFTAILISTIIMNFLYF